MTRSILRAGLAILVVFIVVWSLLLAATPVGTPSQPAATADRCWEGEPCWDCATMGNRVCGTISMP